MASATPDLRLPSQLQGITAPWPVPKFTAEGHVCEQLAQGCYLKMERPGVEPVTFCFASQHPNHYTTRPQQHIKTQKINATQQLCYAMINKKRTVHLSFLSLFCQRLLCSICLFLQIYHLLSKPVCFSLNHFKSRLCKLLFSPQVSASQSFNKQLSLTMKNQNHNNLLRHQLFSFQ